MKKFIHCMTAMLLFISLLTGTAVLAEEQKGLETDTTIEEIAGITRGAVSGITEGQIGQYLEGVLSLFGMSERTLKNADIAKIPDQKYTGSAITPNPRVSYLGVRLRKGTDYTVTYSNNTRLGTAKCRITGKGEYSGSRTVSFKIVRRTGSTSGSTSSKKRLTVKITKTEFTYNGKSQKPSVKVTVSGKSVSSRNYTVKYKDNKDVGRASVVVTGRNDYRGYKGTTSFKIVPRKISFSTAKSSASGTISLSWKKESQADGYQVEYCTRKAFDKNTHRKDVRGSTTTSCELTGLTPGKTCYVRLRSYTTVGKSKWFGEWSAPRKVNVKA